MGALDGYISIYIASHRKGKNTINDHKWGPTFSMASTQMKYNHYFRAIINPFGPKNEDLDLRIADFILSMMNSFVYVCTLTRFE